MDWDDALLKESAFDEFKSPTGETHQFLLRVVTEYEYTIPV